MKNRDSIHPSISAGNQGGEETKGGNKGVALFSPEADQFSLLWETCRVSIRAYLSSFIPDPALVDDCLQDVALIAWQKAPLHRDREDFLAYSIACARRVALATVRKTKSGRWQPLDPKVALALADAQRLHEPDLEATENRVATLRACISLLDPKQREILEVRYGASGNRSLAGEATRLGRSLDSVYKQIERLRNYLRRCVTRRTRDWAK